MSYFKLIFIILIILGIINTSLSSYITYILKKNGFDASYSNIGYFKELRDFYSLSKREKRYKKIFFLDIIFTVLLILAFLSIVIYAIYS